MALEKDFGSIAFYNRRSVDRREVEDRRLFLKQEYLDQNPQRRVSMIDRRMHGDRRRNFPEIMKNSWKKYS
jgi:hypothetical protein